MGKEGSLGYQMMKALQGVFRPGHSSREDRKHGRTQYIRGIGTMRSMVADVFGFGRWTHSTYPEVHLLGQVSPEIAQAYLAELVRRDVSGGRIGRVAATLRKLDAACRRTGVFAEDAPQLLPLAEKEGMTGFHSDPRPVSYGEEEADRIVAYVKERDPQVGLLLELMQLAGLRVSEAAFLRNTDIDPEAMTITLKGAVNHTKGGRPRQITIARGKRPILVALMELGSRHPDGHVFTSRRSLASRARAWVRKACEASGIEPLGTHGLRKTFATQEFCEMMGAGIGEKASVRMVARQLGHNRTSVVKQSYLSPEVRSSAREEP